MVGILGLIFATLLFTGCGESVGVSGARLVPPDSTKSFLKSVTFTGEILQKNPRFISYSKKSGRVSIVDPQQERIVWSREAPGFEFAVHLNSLQGMALFADERILVMEENVQKSFPLKQQYAQTAVAQQNAAYSVAAEDGQSFEVIRYKGGGQWQHQTFNVPWEPINTDNLPADQISLLLVTVFNHDGTVLTALSPVDGRYAVFRAASLQDDITDASGWCIGDGVGTAENPTFRSLTWDEKRKLFFAGDKQGQMYVLNTASACIDIAALPSLQMPDNLPIMRVALLEQGVLGVVQDGTDVVGKLTKVMFDGFGFSISDVYEGVCHIPLSAMLLKDSFMVILCVDQIALTSSHAELEPFIYVTLNTQSGEVINRHYLEGTKSTGVVIDADKQTLYRMLEGGFGDLEVTNLLSGETRTRKNLYLADILK